MSNPVVIPTVPGQAPMGVPAGAPSAVAGIAASVVGAMPVPQPTAGGAPDLRSFDISGVKESRNFDELMPDGLAVEGRISGAKMDQNQNSGKWGVKFVLDVDFPAEVAGLSVWGQATVTTDNPFVYASLIRATDLEAGGKFTGNSVQDLNGRRVRWVNQVDEYNGKKSNKHGAFRHAKETSATPGKTVAPAPTAPTFVPPTPQAFVPTPAPQATEPLVVQAPQFTPEQMAAFQQFQAQQAAAAAAVVAPPAAEPDFTSPPPQV